MIDQQGILKEAKIAYNAYRYAQCYASTIENRWIKYAYCNH